MQIKSNLDMLQRMTIAVKANRDANNIIYSHQKCDKHGLPYSGQFTPLTSKQMVKISKDLFEEYTAIFWPLVQARKDNAEKYVHFPHQNKQLNDIFGNHKCTQITKIKKHGNQITLTLGHQREAMTTFLDVLNNRKNRKNQDIEKSISDIPHYVSAKVVPKGSLNVKK